MISAAAALLLFCSGCSTFRKLFSPDYGKQRRDRRSEAFSSKKRDEKRTSRSHRDPVMDMFKIKNKPDYMEGKNLTPYERALLKQQMDFSNSDAAVERIRSDYQSEKKKRRDWVFGR